MSKKDKKGCTVLSYIEHWLLLTSVVNECVSVSACTFFDGIPIGIMVFAMGLKVVQ